MRWKMRQKSDVSPRLFSLVSFPMTYLLLSERHSVSACYYYCYVYVFFSYIYLTYEKCACYMSWLYGLLLSFGTVLPTCACQHVRRLSIVMLAVQWYFSYSCASDLQWFLISQQHRITTFIFSENARIADKILMTM